MEARWRDDECLQYCGDEENREVGGSRKMIRALSCIESVILNPLVDMRLGHSGKSRL